jgi:hypothetical protein
LIAASIEADFLSFMQFAAACAEFAAEPGAGDRRGCSEGGAGCAVIDDDAEGAGCGGADCEDGASDGAGGEYDGDEDDGGVERVIGTGSDTVTRPEPGW